MLPATPPAIRKSLEILATHRALFGGKRRTMAEADIARVVQIFQQVNVRWALVGAHAVGLLTEPRATADFDFIIDDRKLKAVLAALERAFGELDLAEIGAAVRLRAIDVDLIRSTNHPLFKEALDRTRKVNDWMTPEPEVLLVLKFLAAVNPWRASDRRAQDVVDLRSIYRAVGRDDLDVPLMRKLAGLVYPGAEREYDALLERIDRGEPIQI
jgi:hypothetical protein